MGADGAAFFFEIRNPCRGKRDKDGHGNYLTGKRDKIYHGLGMKEVMEIVKKYNGEMDVCDENGEFDVKALLYMDRALAGKKLSS